MTTTVTSHHARSLTKLGYSLSNQTRTSILLALQHGPKSSGELTELLGTSPQKVSNHLACLLGCGLVSKTMHGRNSSYSLSTPRLSEGLSNLLRLSLEVDPGCCTEQGCTCQ